MVVSVTPQQAFELISHGDVEVIDVRNAEEWSAGYVAGVRLVPLPDLRSDPAAALAGLAGSGERGVLFVCAGGVRSQTTGRVALAYGLTRVYSVIGGMDSWERGDLPLEHARVAV